LRLPFRIVSYATLPARCTAATGDTGDTSDTGDTGNTGDTGDTAAQPSMYECYLYFGLGIVGVRSGVRI
jgi:hypothetical protein